MWELLHNDAKNVVRAALLELASASRMMASGRSSKEESAELRDKADYIDTVRKQLFPKD